MNKFILMLLILVFCIGFKTDVPDIGDGYSCVVVSVDLDGGRVEGWYPCYKVKTDATFYNHKSMMCNEIRCVHGHIGRY